MKPIFTALGLSLSACLLDAADIVPGSVSTLGPDLLLDEAATGGSDVDSFGNPERLNLIRDLGPFVPGVGGVEIGITGLAFGMPAGGNADGNVITATITYLGADGLEGGGDDVELGARSDTLVFTTGAGVYVWSFDAPMSATIDGANSIFLIRLESDPGLNGGATQNIRLKTTGGADGAKLTVGGTALPAGGPTGGDGILYEGYAIGSTALAPEGQLLFSDRAALGAGDSTAYGDGSVPFALQYSGIFNVGAEVVITGMALPLRTPTSTGTLSFDFYDPGADESFSGIATETYLGTASGSLQADLTAAGVYHVNFATPVSFTSLGTGVVVHVQSDAAIRFKIAEEGQASEGTGAQAYRVNAESGGGFAAQSVMKTSLAGLASGGVVPAVVTASGSGFWDTLGWNASGGGSVSGDLGETDSAEIGGYREVSYRGVPAEETVKALQLGESGTSGQGTLRIVSGHLSTTGELRAGLGAGANDSFVWVEGGTLAIGEDASFGLFSEAVDGSLIVAGGSVEIGGNLEMGGYEFGGAMLRFHNPGSSPPVQVGGSLVLGRCALDMTFDAGYTHVPGATISLVEYASRDGQFANFRRGDEFNCGPNRFRIDYDVPRGGKLAIELTALENWTTETTPPNIVFIFSDDQGYSDLSLNGDPDFADKYPMPELDAIATAGARFTDAYVTGGVCHPSRCGILSGRYQQRFGTDNNLSGPSYNGLPPSQRSVPRRLQGLGYRTYGVGKWHLGETVEFHPNVRGFDRWYGMWGGSRSFYDGTSENHVFQDQMTPDFAAEGTEYLTDRIGDATVDFIDEHAANHAGEPFYIYMSFTAVHAPMDIQAMDARFGRLQSEFGLTASDYEDSPIVFGGSNQATVDANRYELAAMTLALDENIGKVVDKVESLGLTENTIFVYMTDNGGAGWSQSFGGNYSYNSPLRGYKGGSMTDGSIRVPCAMKWEGAVPSGQVVSEPVIALDFMASFVNAGGAPAAARNGLDGLDLLPLLRDGVPLPAERVLTWRAGGVSGGGSAVRMGDWKLLINDPANSGSLYHLPSDPDENNNLAASEPEIAAELRRRFQSWEASTLPPLYGTSSTLVDAGLERTPLAGGLRLRSESVEPAWLSAPFREALPLTQDFHLRFLARSTEPMLGAAAELGCGLGDSDDRGSLLRAVLDFGAGEMRLENGRSGETVAAPLAGVPLDFQQAALDFNASTGELRFSFGSSAVALSLGVGYGPLSHYAWGVAGMEGEITTLVPTSGGDLGAGALEAAGWVAPDRFALDYRFPGQPPFSPAAERSASLMDFADDPGALIESLGGGLYRASFTTDSAEPRAFFRFRFDQP